MAIINGKLQQNSPLMSVLSMFQQGKSLATGGNSSSGGSKLLADAGTDTPETQPTQVLGSGLTAMDRRASSQQTPELMMNQGLEALKDPNFPGSYDEKMAYVEPLLRAKHFGFGGGAKGQSSGQGQINSGNEKGGLGGAAGSVLSAAEMIA